MPVMIGRCEICGGSFELPLVWDPLTWRTDFDFTDMAKHQVTHTATAPRSEPTAG